MDDVRILQFLGVYHDGSTPRKWYPCQRPHEPWMQTLDSSGWSILWCSTGSRPATFGKAKRPGMNIQGRLCCRVSPLIPSFSPEGSLRRTQASEGEVAGLDIEVEGELPGDRKSTRLNSSHSQISYA